MQGRLDLNLADGDMSDLSLDKKQWILHNEDELTKQLGSVINSKTRHHHHLSKARSYRSLNSAKSGKHVDMVKPFLKPDKKGDRLAMVRELVDRLESKPLK